MNNIVIESIGFKNFLCYGSSWQEIELKNGINFVTGIDKDKNKNNGAGKSAFLEAILFALFGKVARNIKQDQIINWKNRNKCEVVVKFTLNNDRYKVFRSLKPNKLEIYKNDNLIDQDANKGNYQALFEEIFGMDVKMFMNLIHSNINNSGGILTMNKTEKRAFIEKMFGLEIYSDMNKLSNEKLRKLDEKKFKAEVKITGCDSKIKNADDFKDKFKIEIQDKKKSIGNVDEIKKRLDRIKNDNLDILTDIDNKEKLIDEKRDIINSLNKEFEKENAVLNNRLESINNELLKLEDQDEQRKKNELVKVDLQKIIDEQGDFDDITENIKKLTVEKDDKKEKLDILNKQGLELHKEISGFQADLKNIQENLKLLSDGKCPTCGQDVKDPINGFKSNETSLRNKINYREKKMSELNDKSSFIQETISDLSNEINTLLKLKDEIVELKSRIKNVSSESDKEKLIKSKNSIEQEIKNKEKSYNIDAYDFKTELKVLKDQYAHLMEIEKNISNIQKEYDIAVSKEEEIKKSIESLQKMIKEQDEIIDKTLEEKKGVERDIVKLNDLSDYLNTIKFLLKDENIKQFTIKQIIPFLNKQANNYLSEVNYGFYISIDKWLDVDIKGPGIRNASYDNLSGGERRGIDLALQLALLDVSRLQSGLFPDILVFDEILDSSIDNAGINQLMKIIKTKQREFGGKIFIITHRSEIPQDLMDNSYFVEKSNGFSKIKIL